MVSGSGESLLGQLPGIVAEGRLQAARALEAVDPGDLRVREWVRPAQGGDAGSGQAGGRLIRGDNLLVLAALVRDRQGQGASVDNNGVDLIYIDPPFDSKARYRSRIALPVEEGAAKPVVVRQVSYSDTWTGGTASYLAMLTPRLVLMRELLSATGAIWVHLDWHVGAYVKIILDEIFGRENFVNEIVWSYRNSGLKAAGNKFHSKHDVLYLYTRSSNYRYNGYLEPLREGDTGRRRAYKFNSSAGKAEPVYDEAGKPVYFHVEAIKAGSVWEIPILQGRGESLGFATQKPEALLERVILSTTHPGDVVADFFGGSGTAAAVAEKLGRQWISVDSGAYATMLARGRLIAVATGPFTGEVLDDHARGWLRVGAVVERPQEGERTLLVELLEYAPVAVEDVDLGARHRVELAQVAERAPLALLDTWSVDADYDGEVFRPTAHVVRDRATGSVVATAVRLPAPLPGAGRHRVCVRAWDLFGHCCEAVVSLEC